jgi:putative photosynthetic complex assembly protein 2
MLRLALPMVFAVLVWWAGTGLILWMNRLPPRTYPWSFAAATLVAVAAVAGLWVSAGSTTVAGAYCAFSCAILLWAWQEIAFLFGYVTGPRRCAATPAVAGWARAVEAFRTVQHHEFALLVLAGAVFLAGWGQPNQTGTWTFVVLWAMRQSAKLNLFLGVRNLFEEFLPHRLRYLASYFRQGPVSLLFPLTLVGSIAWAVPLWHGALQAGTEAAAVGLALVATLLALAILEHLFMVLPLPSAALWRWALRSR